MLLIAAAFLKLRQLARPASMTLPGLLSRPAFLAALINAEFLLAIWLLVGGFSRLRFICAVCCFTLFAAASGYEALHAVSSCGCFGNVKIPPGATAALDVLAVAALWFTRDRPGAWAVDWPGRRRLIAGISAVALASAGVWVSYFLSPPAAAAAQDRGDLVVLDPAGWVNRPFPLLDKIDGAAPLRSGRWMVLLYHSDCDDCLRAIPQYQALAQSNSGVRVAFVAMPPFAAADTQAVPDSPQYLRLTLRPDYDWFATTPLVASLQDGLVLAAAAGDGAVRPPDVPQWRQ